MSVSALLRIIQAADNHTDHECAVVFWYLLLDTSSNVSELVPPGNKAPSTRLTREYKFLLVWPYMFFDIRTPGPDERMKLIRTPKDALRITFLKSYGRPVSVNSTLMYIYTHLNHFLLSFGTAYQTVISLMWSPTNSSVKVSERTTLIMHSPPSLPD